MWVAAQVLLGQEVGLPLFSLACRPMVSVAWIADIVGEAVMVDHFLHDRGCGM